MQLIDVVFLIISLVCGFLLYTKLGNRTAVHKAGRFGAKPGADPASSSARAPVTADLEAPLLTGINQIRQHDKKFSLHDFMSFAKDRFETILRSFLSAEEDKLKPLLSPEFYAFYSSEIQALRRDKIKGELDFFRMVSAKLKEVFVEANIAKIKVHFVSEQTQIRRNDKGEIVEGDLNHIDRISELWTFERPVKTRAHWLVSGIAPYEAP